MEILMTSVVVLMLLYLLSKQVIAHIRDERRPDDVKLKVMLTLLAEIILAMLFPIADATMMETAFFLSFSLVGLYFATLSFVPKDLSSRIFTVIIIVEGFYAIYRFVSIFADIPVPSEMFFLYGIMTVPLLIMIVYSVCLFARIADIKYVMRIGSVWNSVCVIVDVIYLAVLVAYTWVCAVVVIHSGTASVPLMIVFAVLMISIQMALTVRLEASSLFVVWTRHERRIVESMRLTNADMNAETPGSEALYRNIYDRVLEYFERSRPYLNPDLTINDIVNALFTNKVYISKAICAYTCRNFCQFVNYYRISYAVDLFRSNPSLKVVDISTKSGFNSSVSFTMAFRLFMNEKPSEWFRRERAVLQKQKGRNSR